LKQDERDASAAERRTFLKQVAGVAGVASVSVQGAAAAQAVGTPTAAATAAAPPPANGYLSLSADEAVFVEALVNLMCPADEFTPAGVDCGLATFIDRQLAGEFGKGTRRYLRGPWGQEGRPQQGSQLPLTPEQYFKAGLEAASAACVRQHGKPFDLLSHADSDAFLHDLAAGKVDGGRVNLSEWFSELLYPLFNQACFADPIYGGNANKVFWKMIGYPGLPATHTLDAVKYRGKPFPGAQDPKSIADFS
jgi:gluconate 2-dehydrogenase gamma chain